MARSADPALAALGIGRCEWTGCGAVAIEEIEADVYPRRLNGKMVTLRHVEVCYDHAREWRRTGRLNVPWERVIRAVELGTPS